MGATRGADRRRTRGRGASCRICFLRNFCTTSMPPLTSSVSASPRCRRDFLHMNDVLWYVAQARVCDRHSRPIRLPALMVTRARSALGTG